MRTRICAGLLAAAALVVVALLLVPFALADGDPASDVLLGESVYFPFAPAVSGALQRTLNAETAAANRAGLPVKVALIDTPPDLGVLTSLFGRPQRYADFLDQEISLTRGVKLPLLVVMRTGFGVQGIGGGAKRVVASLRKPTGGQSDRLARAALAAAAGALMVVGRRRRKAQRSGHERGIELRA